MKFLVAIDGSQAGEHALDKALALAAPLKAEIVLLTVVEPLSSYVPEVMLPTGDWVGWRGRLETGQPRDVICYVTKEESPDLLVLGSRGLGSIERLMLGSVSDYVVHHCVSPVLIVR